MDYTIARKNNSGAILWSEDQTRYIIEEYTKRDKTLKSLAQEFQVQPQSIRNLLRKQKITITNKKIRDYPRISNYFHMIDTAEKAYWIGMLLSDGAIYKNSITLNLKDKEHVEKFRQAIGAVNKITETIDNRWTKPCKLYQFTIRDSEMVTDLAQYGIVQNKSYKDFGVPQIPAEFIWDFIRGYFDGDGSIFFTQNKYVLSWVGNKQFLTELRTILNKENVSLDQNSQSKITYQLKISGKKDVYYFLHQMYDNSTENTRLDRKYKLVQQALSLEAHHL